MCKVLGEISDVPRDFAELSLQAGTFEPDQKQPFRPRAVFLPAGHFRGCRQPWLGFPDPAGQAAPFTPPHMSASSRSGLGSPTGDSSCGT